MFYQLKWWTKFKGFRSPFIGSHCPFSNLSKHREGDLLCSRLQYQQTVSKRVCFLIFSLVLFLLFFLNGIVNAALKLFGCTLKCVVWCVNNVKF